MVLHLVVLKAIRSYLITTLTAAGLLFTVDGPSMSVLCLSGSVEAGEDGDLRFIQRVLSRTTLSGGDDARGVNDATRVLMLVAMLTTSTCARVPLDSELAVIELDDFLLCFGEHCHGDGRCMNSTLSLGWRNSHDTMTTGFCPQACQILTDDLERDFTGLGI